ncbi:MAG: hypothetical protein IJF94_04500 [Eubacterium sp.]|nr:hypothetical protein [Eubacterium sp.]
MARVSNRSYRNEYVSGNTIRKAEPFEDQRIERSKRRDPAPETRALPMNFPLVGFMVIVSIACVALAIAYLNMMSQITQAQTDIKSIKADISTIQSQNEARKYAISSCEDSDKIYKVATTKLGMKQASGSQIYRYKTSDTGYTVQYGDIPTR